MKKTKAIAEINIWERYRDWEHSSSPNYIRDIYRSSLRTKGKFLTFKTTDDNIVAYNTESIFKYEIEPD